MGNWFSCGKEGHKVRYFPNIKSQEKESGKALPSATSSEDPKRIYFYALSSRGEQEESLDVVTDMSQVFIIDV